MAILFGRDAQVCRHGILRRQGALRCFAQPRGQVLGDEEGGMRLRSLRRHGKVGKFAGLVGKRQTLRALLRNQSGGITEAHSHCAPLIREVGTVFGIQRVTVDHRIIQEAARKVMAQRIATPLIAVRHMLRDH
ncbi:hypothetical protein D9M68_359860 [compost metagenome]